MIPVQKPEQDASNSTRTNGPHWSKDFVEHLRTIHFSLIALCLGAVVISFASGRNEIQLARQEIATIDQLLHAWDPNWIQSDAEALVHAEELKLEQQRFADSMNATPDASRLHPTQGRIAKVRLEANREFASKYEAAIRELPRSEAATRGPVSPGPSFLDSAMNSKNLAFKFAGPNWLLDGPVRTYIHLHSANPPDNQLFQSPDLRLEKPTTLQQFRDCWNALGQDHKIRIPVELSSNVFQIGRFTDQGPFYVLRQGVWSWSSINSSKPTVQSWSSSMYEYEPTFATIESHLLWSPEEVTTLLPYNFAKPSYYVSDKESLVIPVKTYKDLDFIPEEVISGHFRNLSLTIGSFGHSFPNLDGLAANFGDFDFNKLDVALKDLQNRTGESFEAFGIKIPAEATARWGILVILAVQLYLWLHLFELKQKLQPDDPGWEVAFIGMYSSLPSRVVYFVSSCLLPVAAIVALGMKGLHAGDSRALIVNLLILGTIVSGPFIRDLEIFATPLRPPLLEPRYTDGSRNRMWRGYRSRYTKHSCTRQPSSPSLRSPSSNPSCAS